MLASSIRPSMYDELLGVGHVAARLDVSNQFARQVPDQHRWVQHLPDLSSAGSVYRTFSMQRHVMALVEMLSLIEVPIMRFLTHATILASLACSPVLVQAQQAQQATQAAAPVEVDGFARAAAENNLSEVLLASMALQRTNDKRVQDDAWTMLDHHSRALGELAEALSEGAALLPTEPSSDQRASLQRMRDLSGTQFDQAYFAYQLEAHQRAINLFERAGQVSDRKVAQYARVTLPVLRAHREIAQYRQGQPPQPMPVQ